MGLDLTNFCVMKIPGSRTDPGPLGKGFKKDPGWGEGGRGKRKDSGHAKTCVAFKWLMGEGWDAGRCRGVGEGYIKDREGCSV